MHGELSLRVECTTTTTDSSLDTSSPATGQERGAESKMAGKEEDVDNGDSATVDEALRVVDNREAQAFAGSSSFWFALPDSSGARLDRRRFLMGSRRSAV